MIVPITPQSAAWRIELLRHYAAYLVATEPAACVKDVLSVNERDLAEYVAARGWDETSREWQYVVDALAATYHIRSIAAGAVPHAVYETILAPAE